MAAEPMGQDETAQQPAKGPNDGAQKFYKMIDDVDKPLYAGYAKLPKDHYEAKEIVRDLGFNYEKIHTCPNDCILFWKDNVNLEACPCCKESRWKMNEASVTGNNALSNKGKKKAAKILRWFPLKPRLQRLFLSPDLASSMKWHVNGHIDDGVMRHPANPDAWKMFDTTYLQFSSEPHNVRLGLAANGFNLFGIMSTTHNTWLVMLVPYNLPPWLCMKWSSLILSLLIPGPTSLGIAIDVYLQPLVEELRELWDVGVEAFDASSKNVFQLRAALMWTVHYFPVYIDVSGWSTKGHRRWLDSDHKFWDEDTLFDGSTDMRVTPMAPVASDILVDTGNLVRQKNMMDNILGTVLSKKDWTKDNYKARLDFADMGIRSELHLRRKGDDKYMILPACFHMTPSKKDGFLQVLWDVKVPDGYASNISRRVNLKECKISGLKSHDNHILMQQLLPITLRRSLSSHITGPLIKLACFFRKICSKTLTVSEIENDEAEIAVTLCELEKIFPPSFSL
ncbi:uncharacterized protein LOC126721937 [Quercus robur]|uniref:uncharacterized protein LOC126721937 n=1 Tax=Quercus robur TaxID=38942 RepID=UPI002162DEA2|nr:uncharacterized protein LOC126721937 [Quercus robur]